VRDGGITLTEGVDYTLSYSNNINVGKATITVMGMGNYSGTKQAFFNIVPKRLRVIPVADQQKEYGESDPELSYSFSGEITGEFPAFISSLSRAPGENVGVYEITQGSLSLADNGSFKASNYEIVITTGVGYNITKAALTITANNDSKFVTQPDVNGYAGVRYSGFKFGENKTVLNTTNLTLVRTNAGTEAAGVYTDVLEATGVTSQNYSISYQKGDFTIVGADQLLVKLKATEVIYGEAPQYEVAEAGYYSSDNQLIQDLTASTQIDGTEVTATDGAMGTGVFDIAVVAPQLSSSGNLSIGNYTLDIANVSVTSPNFSNTIVLQGTLEVLPKVLTVGLVSSAEKVYDGNSNMLGLALALNTPIVGDILSVSGTGVYASKDAGVGNYTVSGLGLNGTDAGNYFIQGGAAANITGTDGEITSRALTVTPDSNQSKVFGAADPLLTYRYTGLVSGEVPGFSGAMSRLAGEAQGTYEITRGALALEDNGSLITH